MTRQLRVSFVCTVAALTAACQSTATSFESYDPTLYAVVLDSLFSADTVTLRHGIVLSDSTAPYPREKLATQSWSDLNSLAQGDSALVRDFERHTRTAEPLRPREIALKAALRMPFQLANDADYERIARSVDSLRTAAPVASFSPTDAYWQIFHRTFANATGSVTLSAIGYNRDGTAALLHVSYACGPLCGAGHLVLLQRTPTGWHLHKIYRTWAS